MLNYSRPLVITESESMQTGRKWYFLFSSVMLGTALSVGLVTSLFSIDLSLGNNDFELVRLMTPVELPVAEPAPLAANERVEQPISKDRVAVKAPERRVTKVRPMRRVNMARLNETPPAVPDSVSTSRNTEASRPENRYFELGKLDFDPGAGLSSGRITSGTASSGSGAGLSAASSQVAPLEETEPPPPPRITKKPAAAKKPVIRSMGVINGKATSLPMPIYPAAAKAVNVKGKVSVRVLVNERGQVISADAVSGHPLLRNSAETAARKARFSPTLLSGEAVKTSGVIVYNFLG
ncbi:MAG: TonB family protein [Pyrinomonadaceae bacterium]